MHRLAKYIRHGRQTDRQTEGRT